MTNILEISYNDNRYYYNKVDDNFLSFLDTLLRGEESFELIVKKSSE